MFTQKKTSLIDKKQSTDKVESTTMNVPTNPFLKAGFKASVTTNSLGNGATKLTTTGSDFVDQFAKATNYKAPRSYQEIDADMRNLWRQNKTLTVALTFYLRMITRIVKLFSGEKTTTTQRGQGLKHEGIFRMMWLAINEPKTFWKNITLFISIGSWKDVITMLSYDLQYNGWENRKLDWHKFGQLILAGLENPNTSELVKKYLPQIKAESQCHTIEAQADTMIGQWICSLLFGNKPNPTSGTTYKKYRKLKSSGTAHEWQQLISKGNFLSINFNSIHGRALAQLVSGNFITNNGLEEKYQAWIESQPVAKYTGYVYELLAPIKIGYINANLKRYQIDTINKQFYGKIETDKKGMKEGTSLIVVVDTSSSMTSAVPGTKVSSYSIAKAMALYFSYLLKGPFAKSWMEFADTCKLNFWKGSTPVENLQLDKAEAYGSTNFQGVADTFGKILKQTGSEKDFPSGILCVSDGCFNGSGSNQSSFKILLGKLRQYGFSEEYVKNFKVILWDIPNGYYGGKAQTAFEEFADCPNLFHISGLDGSAVAFITGTEKQESTPKNSEELFQAAMNQEVLNLIEL